MKQLNIIHSSFNWTPIFRAADISRKIVSSISLLHSEVEGSITDFLIAFVVVIVVVEGNVLALGLLVEELFPLVLLLLEEGYPWAISSIIVSISIK